ncbi:hypothetical protein ASE25_04900 [Terrabacter sp. Root85]|uniref:hemerythrin domain-containing protein n=1 Tax=Terrabacter sp. Root85 TaxID=1736603 RepID=UPI0006F31EB3|nr:hemerythrin domain-containing protein [Terrabacter sp. Root85]KRC92658.1 hypothetical protein ASE25_04900 [Terrabacter sp. Root85]
MPPSSRDPRHDDQDRTAALAAQLSAVHDDLRARVRVLRDGLGRDGAPAVGASSPVAGLLAHCLGFCRALQAHHTGEDDGLFAALRAERPDLGPMLDKLAEDHHLVAGILTRVAVLAEEASETSEASGARRTRLAGELDGLMAIMDSHFAFEERSIGAALDGLDDQSWVGAVLTVRGT